MERLSSKDVAQPGKPLHCTAMRKNGERCKGWSIHGRDKCRIHSLGALALTKHGRYSKYPLSTLQEKYEEFVTDPNIKDLRPEISHLRTLLDSVVQSLADETNSQIVTKDNPVNVAKELVVSTSGNPFFQITNADTKEKIYVKSEKTADVILSWFKNSNGVNVTKGDNVTEKNNVSIKGTLNVSKGKLNMSGISSKGMRNGKVEARWLLVLQIADRISKVVERLHRIEEGMRYTVSIEGVTTIVQIVSQAINNYVTEDYIREHSTTEARKQIAQTIRSARIS